MSTGPFLHPSRAWWQTLWSGSPAKTVNTLNIYIVYVTDMHSSQSRYSSAVYRVWTKIFYRILKRVKFHLFIFQEEFENNCQKHSHQLLWHLPHELAFPLLNIYLQKFYTKMFTAALLILAKNWKQPKCPLTGKCIQWDIPQQINWYMQ